MQISGPPQRYCCQSRPSLTWVKSVIKSKADMTFKRPRRLPRRAARHKSCLLRTRARRHLHLLPWLPHVLLHSHGGALCQRSRSCHDRALIISERTGSGKPKSQRRWSRAGGLGRGWDLGRRGREGERARASPHGEECAITS